MAGMNCHTETDYLSERMPAVLLTRVEQPAILGCSTRTLARMVIRGDLDQVKVGPRLCRYRRTDIEALINAESAVTSRAPSQTEASPSHGET